MIPDKLLYPNKQIEGTSDSQSLTEQLKELNEKYPRCQNSGRLIKDCTCGYCSQEEGMTIDEAIEILTRRIQSPFVRTNTASLEATKLGIEALKAWRDKRLFSSRLAYHLLPGETQ